MKCPFCDFKDTQVTNSRPVIYDTSIKRRRICNECGTKFTTFEKIEVKDPLVVKRNGEKTQFNRSKILISMEIAVRKRGIDKDTLEDSVENIAQQLRKNQDKTVTTEMIGKAVMSELLIIDPVACARYASVYLNFDTLADFSQFIKTLAK